MTDTDEQYPLSLGTPTYGPKYDLSLSQMPVKAWVGPRPQKVGLIKLLLLGISPTAEALPSRCHWKVTRSLLLYPLCQLALRQARIKTKMWQLWGLACPSHP